ncbi:protein bicaudal D [Trichuris trichiura]|uniref:Protein bicaudal D n=1 Tax=Trichuris trichiura TaxID=36087 RepID=A0A077Z593_TRITR|nr:protein bicaudal D [Trichuris trichiura]
MEEGELSADGLDKLKREVSRLTCELDEANHQKIQAAQYGLQVLEEKQLLQAKLEELENSYELNKQELVIAKEVGMTFSGEPKKSPYALSHYQAQNKEVAKHGVQHEEILLAETASRESELLVQISCLEQDFKSSSQELSRCKSELQQLQELQDALKTEKQVLDGQARAMKKEIEEMKLREQRMIGEYSELEEENLSSARSAQIDIDSVKYELERIHDEAQLLRFQKDESAKLREIAEKQVEEALHSLQQEREHRLALKKELDELRNAENLNSNLSSLAHSVLGLGPFDSEVENDSVLRQLQASINDENKNGKQVDLFSEVHGARYEQLESQLKLVSKEKDEAESQLLVISERTFFKPRTNELKKQMNTVIDTINKNVIDIISLLCDDVTGHNRIGLSDGGSLLTALEKEFAGIIELIKPLLSVGQSKFDVASSKTKFSESNQLLQEDLRTLLVYAVQTKCTLLSALAEVSNVSETLAQFYHHVCTRLGLGVLDMTPDLVMLDHTKEAGLSKSESFEIPYGEVTFNESIGGIDAVPASSNKSEDFGTFMNSATDIVQSLMQKLKSDYGKGLVIDIVKDQISSLTKAVDNAIQKVAQNDQRSSHSRQDMEEMDQLNVRLRSLLSAKREQIATLRAVLRSNKQTAETVLQQLRQRYGTEKQAVNATMKKLRDELKTLKEDAATFASVRAMFTARCSEYQAQIEDYQRQLAAAEEEKKTVNSLLRMAIQQKLALTQRLEDLEMDRERSNMRRQTGAKTQARSVNSGGSSASRSHYGPSGQSALGASSFRPLSVRQRRDH